jgi:hypothetical protein
MTSENPVVEVRSGEEFNLDAVDSILKRVIPGLSGRGDFKSV